MSLDTNEAKGLRYNTGKPKWSLVDWPSLVPMVKVLEYGATKYTVRDASGNITHDGTDNWKGGVKTTEICESMLRHIFAYLDGQDNDPESGLSHIGHLLCNAMFLSYMVEKRPDLDTRKIIRHNPEGQSPVPKGNGLEP